eukprot:scaffold334_cov241-Pinguiococcus_pyrenoidosus.AAC.68
MALLATTSSFGCASTLTTPTYAARMRLSRSPAALQTHRCSSADPVTRRSPAVHEALQMPSSCAESTRVAGV